MKKILLPTDFSKNSLMACHFAIHLLKEKETKFILNHVYDIPRGGTSGLFYLMEELQKQGKEGLKEFKSQLLSDFEEIDEAEIETHLLQGDFADQTTRLAEELKVDCIVMGTKGSTGLKEVLVGSSTLQLMKNSKQPLYIVPKNYQSIKMDKLIVAYDGKGLDKKTAEKVRYFSKKHNLPIELLHVRLDEEPPIQDWTEVKKILKDYPIDIHESWGENLEEGLKKGLEGSEGLLVMTFRKKSFWERFFNISDCRNAVMHAELPILIVPES